MDTSWLPMAACAWFGASMVVATFAGKIALLAGRDGSLLTKKPAATRQLRAIERR
jgi:hypothetical protein